MATILKRLAASGPGKDVAEITFNKDRYLIRGPSDTGKSYIRDCLWYLLGGDKVPKYLPEAEGYDLLTLEIESKDGRSFEFKKALAGGSTAICEIFTSDIGIKSYESVNIDENELLVKLSGSSNKLLLRSKSKKGPVTSGDLRHWFLLSQPNMISEDATSGTGFSAFQRIGAFSLILTGNDDSAIQISKSSAEVERIKGQLGSAQDALKRAESILPNDITRNDVSEAIERVESTLSSLTEQYQARALQLKELRVSLRVANEDLNKAMIDRDHSASMVERFELLDMKYSSDLGRLVAINEGVGLFQNLSETPCPLCETPLGSQLNPSHLNNKTQQQFRIALLAEVEKIRLLRKGLLISHGSEKTRLAGLNKRSKELQNILNDLESREKITLNATKVEFSADPKTLAVRLSELSSQLNSFDEIERLKLEIENLKTASIRKKVPLDRNAGESLVMVSNAAKRLLNSWGFEEVERVTLDLQACDLIINDRARLSYGAGKRAIFLAALSIALLDHAMTKGHPHLGFIVIDSPLKAYSDPESFEFDSKHLKTVTENFYEWLSTWQGPGQIIIIENEQISSETAKRLHPLQFTRVNGQGRPGFYPVTKEEKNI
ncbi:hypothetical protein [Methylotenera sp. 1P/1]|uniref:hypothetical protein n=1 Tax=Methylotenera sp. 1P/1 TaxID=1131551 RepID=UPI00035F4E91|nr:hypothetical protein [Methylotenera sp. 1P/1]